jgi:co-chaperonin GroES (HSP10)
VYTWQKFRPMWDWLTVKADPRKTETKNGLVLPDIELLAERVMEGTGTVLRVGPTIKKTLGVDLNPGDRICFRGYMKDVFHDFEEVDGCRVFLLRGPDVLMIIDKDVELGMLS